jgi:hypothetical protein
MSEPRKQASSLPGYGSQDASFQLGKLQRAGEPLGHRIRVVAAPEWFKTVCLPAA